MTSEQKATGTFSHLKFTTMQERVYLIKAGDRVPGDDLILALREHRDGPLPKSFVEYLEKALSGWTENKPGAAPKGKYFRTDERIYLKLLYREFTAVINGNGEGLDEVLDFASEHLTEIDDSFSVSEKASRLVAMYIGKDQRSGPSIMNKIPSSN